MYYDAAKFSPCMTVGSMFWVRKAILDGGVGEIAASWLPLKA
jgi:hypothetical protein